jgi:hypothetical protein
MFDDPDSVVPLLFPQFVVKGDQVSNRIDFGDFQVTVEFFQRIVDARAHERFDGFNFSFDFVHVTVFILQCTLLVGRKTGMGYGN